ncbi:F-box/FBD/LRR-repeat protein At1g13570-like [Solanum stenotomum]|uniref:F-box/FBD/LRR-repeat protein At1g13570-like n=1 Tax=Solanum stenotomum TaxID=172797 RepID=UPI0020D10ABE|nr:F-box/FBD/LRR-repeat protein At1g13570-like [Solanum stenotomum]
MISCYFKKLKVERDELDRLTDLPINVKHQIQEHLSVEEAARMSVLSRPWKHIWVSIPKLVFSADFCHNKPLIIDVINTILLQHCGAIKTFLVNISSIPSSQHSVIDEWLLLLSRNGIMDLTLQNLDKDRLILNNAPYKLPSCLYGINKLESLSLSNCIFRPTCSFTGFHMLKNLSLLKVVLHLDVATSFLWMPDLVFLQVKLCIGFPNSKIYAPKLSQIFFFTSRTKTLELGHYMDCRMLKTVILASSGTNQDRPINMTYLLKCWPEVRNFGLHTYYLKSVATEAERFPTYLNNLRTLLLFEFDFDDVDHIFALLRMLRISPNLDNLVLRLSSKKKGGIEVNVNHFEGPAYRTLGLLHKLQRLIIKNFHGSTTEMFFVRFILASAPLLLKTVLSEDAESVHESKSSKELMGFRRASPKLQIYVNNKKK